MKTYPRVIEVLQEHLKRTGSVNALVKKTGLTHNTIGNYLEGRSEPTQASLEKIAKAYNKSVAWLRGDEVKKEEPRDRNVDLLARYFKVQDLEAGEVSQVRQELLEILSSATDEEVEAMLFLLRKRHKSG